MTSKANTLGLGGSCYGDGPFRSRKKGKITVEYQTWSNMINRCYNEKYHATRPKSVGCMVAEEWLNFQNFAAWLTNHDYYNLGYFLDKDLLIPKNRLYSADTCLLLPQEINTLIANSEVSDKGLPMGVRKHKDKFKAVLSMDNKQKHLGCFDDIASAFAVYTKSKEDYAKVVAERWRDRIENRAYEALMVWQVQVPDK